MAVRRSGCYRGADTRVIEEAGMGRRLWVGWALVMLGLALAAVSVGPVFVWQLGVGAGLLAVAIGGLLIAERMESQLRPRELAEWRCSCWATWSGGEHATWCEGVTNGD